MGRCADCGVDDFYGDRKPRPNNQIMGCHLWINCLVYCCKLVAFDCFDCVGYD